MGTEWMVVRIGKATPPFGHPSKGGEANPAISSKGGDVDPELSKGKDVNPEISIGGGLNLTVELCSE
jgi:hypothetical protein